MLKWGESGVDRSKYCSHQILTMIWSGKKNLPAWLTNRQPTLWETWICKLGELQDVYERVTCNLKVSKYNYLSRHFKLWPWTTSNNSLWKLQILSIMTALLWGWGGGYEKISLETANSQHWSLKHKLCPWLDLHQLTLILPKLYTVPILLWILPTFLKNSWKKWKELS